MRKWLNPTCALLLVFLPLTIDKNNLATIPTGKHCEHSLEAAQRFFTCKLFHGWTVNFTGGFVLQMHNCNRSDGESVSNHLDALVGATQASNPKTFACGDRFHFRKRASFRESVGLDCT